MDDIPIADTSNILEQYEGPIPFAGREEELILVQQYLNAPQNTHALTFLGRRRIGKTAFLQHLSYSDNPDFVGIYLPLRDIPYNDDHVWIRNLSQTMIAAIQTRSYAPAPIESPPDEIIALREWFAQQCLPTLFRAIRPQRRLLLLFDNAEILLNVADTTESRILHQNLFTYLHGLLDNQLGMVLAVDLAYENDLDKFHPLVNPAKAHRLSRLSPEATARVIQEFAHQPQATTDDTIEAIYQESGGEPTLLRYFGFHLGQLRRNAFSPEDIKLVTPMVNAACENDIRLLWNSLDHNERLALTAISRLLYNDPLRAVNAAIIENWLAQTDYPMDTITINTALRSLEYYELIGGATTNVNIVARLIQRWLLENAQNNLEGKPVLTSTSRSRIFVLAVLLIVTILATVIVIISLSHANVATTPPSVPTVPLSTSTLESKTPGN